LEASAPPHYDPFVEAEKDSLARALPSPLHAFAIPKSTGTRRVPAWIRGSSAGRGWSWLLATYYLPVDAAYAVTLPRFTQYL
jgi:hypothetical protein